MTMDNNIKSVKKLVTHDGSFHTDDVFAAATLSLMLEKKGETFEITRTRDEELIKNADIVFDVGGVYDPESNRFDHHQKGGAGNRPFGDVDIEYASIGLVWKKFGLELCGNQKAVDLIDKKLIAPIDAWDNGFDISTSKYSQVSPYLLQHVFFAMEPTWKESDVNINDVFLKSVEIAKAILMREIIQMRDGLEAARIVLDVYNNTSDKSIIVLDKDYPCHYVFQDFPEPLYVIYPRKMNGWWGIKAVRKDPKTFSNRKNLPASWGGLRDAELVKISGIDDAIFCHKGLNMAVAKSKEGAIKLAQIAVES